MRSRAQVETVRSLNAIQLRLIPDRFNAAVAPRPARNCSIVQRIPPHWPFVHHHEGLVLREARFRVR